MKSNIEKLIIGILGIMIAVSCIKDNPDHLPDVGNTIAQQTELRRNDTLPDFFRSSLTIYDYENQKQIIINRDSLDSISFVRVNSTKAGKTELINNVRYTAGIFRVLFHFKTSESDLSGVYYVKDTARVNIYTHKDFSNCTSLGKYKYRTYIRTDTIQSYFDHRYQKTKKRYLYRVDGEPEYIECWSHVNSNIFFLNHKN
jgi:hypothetical protein